MANPAVDYSIPAEERQGLQTRPVMEPVVDTPRATITPEQRSAQFAQPDYSAIGADKKGYSAMSSTFAPGGSALPRVVGGQGLINQGVGIERPPAASDATATKTGTAYIPSASNFDGTGKVDGADVQATGQEGIRRVNVKGQSPLFTNLDSETAQEGLRGVPSGAPAMTTMDLKGANEGLARANAIRQSILDDPNLGGGGARVSMLPNAQTAETQKLFDKWANEALVRDMMGRRGGENAAASLSNRYGDNLTRESIAQMQQQGHLAGLDLQGRNQLAVTGLQGENQLNVTDLQGQNQLAVAGVQGENQLGVASINNAGGLKRQESENASRESIVNKELQARKESAQSGANDKLYEHLPKMLEFMDPKSEDHKQLISEYLARFRQQTRPAPPPPPQVGEVRNGHRYIGGNPADQASWSAA